MKYGMMGALCLPSGVYWCTKQGSVIVNANARLHANHATNPV